MRLDEDVQLLAVQERHEAHGVEGHVLGILFLVAVVLAVGGFDRVVERVELHQRELHGAIRQQLQIFARASGQADFEASPRVVPGNLRDRVAEQDVRAALQPGGQILDLRVVRADF